MHDLAIGESVDLDRDRRRTTGACMRRLALDARQQRRQQLVRRREDAAGQHLRRGYGIAKRLQQLADAARQRLVAREQTEVGVLPPRTRVVVARAHMRIQHRVLAAPTLHQCELRMHLEPREPVHHAATSALQGARPLHVVLLVEPGLQLDERKHRLAGARGSEQRLHHR